MSGKTISAYAVTRILKEQDLFQTKTKRKLENTAKVGHHFSFRHSEHKT